MYNALTFFRLSLVLLFPLVVAACGSGGGSDGGNDNGTDTIAPVTFASPAGGTYDAAQSVELTSNEEGAIFYTLDGSMPTAESTVYDGIISIDQTASLRFFGVDLAGNVESINTENYSIVILPADTTAPITTANPAGGLFNVPLSVELSPNEAAITYFTLDGSTPSVSSSIYSSPISITNSVSLRYFSVDTEGNTESLKTQNYTIDVIVPVTTAAPEGGTYSTGQSVLLSANETATIYFTTDGSEPDASSSIYSSSINVNSTASLKYFAIDTAGNTEVVNTEIYTIDPDIPTTSASPPGGSYNTSQSVTLTADKPSTIYFTIDGTTPTTASQVYSTAIPVNSTTTIRFFASDGIGNIESVKTQIYTLDTTSPTTTANPLGGLFNTALNVSLTADEAGTTYYTTNGSMPNTSSTIYSSPISLTTTAMLRFFTVDLADNAETIKTQTYTIDTQSPITTANPAGGPVNATQSVSLNVNETASIYYTTDGSTPTTSSTEFIAPISITAPATLRFFAVDAAGNAESVKSEIYALDVTAPTIVASPAAGTYNSAINVTLTANETATIYYTNDGSTPTTGSTMYSSPVNISGNTTLKYIAVDIAGNEGTVSESVYVIDLSTPTIILNDTGINYGGNFPSGNNASCIGETVSEQDCSYGRDATHNDNSDGHAGFSFTKLDANGNDLSSGASNWSCVRDNVTGLVWEVKTDDDGIHDKDNTYRWGGIGAQLSSSLGTVYNEWNTLVNGSNNENGGQGLCNFSDWRVPTREELRSIVSYDRFRNPDNTVAAIDQDYFPIDAFPQPAFGETDINWFWSASPSAQGSAFAWKMLYTSGADLSWDRNEANHVRLVRGD